MAMRCRCCKARVEAGDLPMAVCLSCLSMDVFDPAALGQTECEKCEGFGFLDTGARCAPCKGVGFLREAAP